MSVIEDVELSAEQRAVWRAEMFKLLDGRKPNWVQAAKRLVKLKGEAGGRHSVGGWQSDLTEFAKGSAKGLRAVFAYAERLAVVADHLGVNTQTLVALHARARGEAVADSLDHQRLAGFEDYPAIPIEQAFFAPRCDVRTSTIEHGPSATMSSGQLDIEEIVDLLATDERPEAVVIASNPGNGRSVTLRAIAAACAARNLDCGTWPAISERNRLVFVDDLDRLDRGARRNLMAHATADGRTLIATTNLADALRDHPGRPAVYQLCEGDLDWALRFIDHLKEQVKALPSLHHDFATLREWVQSDPFALDFAGRADTLGALARRLAEDSLFKPTSSLPVILDHSIKRAADRLERHRRKDEANFVRTRGDIALGHLVQLSAARRYSAVQVLEAVLKAGGADGITDAGAHSIAAALEIGQLLHRSGQEYVFSPPVLRTAVLARSLARKVRDGAPLAGDPAVQLAVCDPDALSTLSGAATELNDSAPVLRALEDQPPEVRCSALRQMTRLLATDVPCSDPALLRRWFSVAQAWWLRWPTTARKKQMRLSIRPRPQKYEAGEDEISGGPALVVLGFASRMHKHASDAGNAERGRTQTNELPSDLEVYSRALLPQASELDDPWKPLIADPGQHPLLLDAGFWTAFGSRVWGRPPTAELDFISGTDLQTWFVHAAAPCLAATEDGRRLLAGASSVSIDTFMGGSGRGSKYWRDALAERVQLGDHRAYDAFALAIETALRRAGTRPKEAVRAIWPELSEHAGHLRSRIVARLQMIAPRRQWNDHPFFEWLVTDVLDEASLAELWSAWSDKSLGDVPWEAFVEAGLERAIVADWALREFRSEVTSTDEFANLGPTTEGSAAHVIEQLCKSSCVATLNSIVEAEVPRWSWTAALGYRNLRSTEARHARLRLGAAATDLIRMTLLDGLMPQAGEAQEWSTIAESSQTLAERCLRTLQLALTGRRDAMANTAVLLQRFATQIANPDQVKAEHRMAAEPMSKTVERYEGAEAWAAAAKREMAALLPSVGQLLLVADRCAVKGSEKVAALVVEEPELRQLVGGDQFLAVWAVVWKCLGWAAVERSLVADSAHERMTEQRLDAIWHLRKEREVHDAVLKLLDHKTLGCATARIVARDEPDAALRVLGERALVRRGAPDPVSLTLASTAIGSVPDELLDTLEVELASYNGRQRLQWWSTLLPSAPRGTPRLRVARALFASR